MRLSPFACSGPNAKLLEPIEDGILSFEINHNELVMNGDAGYRHLLVEWSGEESLLTALSCYAYAAFRVRFVECDRFAGVSDAV